MTVMAGQCSGGDQEAIIEGKVFSIEKVGLGFGLKLEIEFEFR